MTDAYVMLWSVAAGILKLIQPVTDSIAITLSSVRSAGCVVTPVAPCTVRRSTSLYHVVLAYHRVCT